MKELEIFPYGTEINDGHLVIGGCDTVALANEYGTPLYIFDEATLRSKCREYTKVFKTYYSDTTIIYASKAFINKGLAEIIKQEGLGLDVVSGGAISIANAVSFPLEKVYFHGNNKSRSELELALSLGVGRVVVDNFFEMSLLDKLAQEAGKIQDVLLRISPGIDPHTHAKTTTGIVDSKFGFPIATGQAAEAVSKAISAKGLHLIGLHCHLGSPIYEMDPYIQGTEVMLKFAAEMRDRHGFVVSEFSPGGGFAIQYTEDKPAPSTNEYAEAISKTIHSACRAYGLPLPKLIIEPGRSIVGQAGVALYTVGAIKDIPGVRKYVSVDGGMADNIRPAIYGSRYEAVVANKAGKANDQLVTICGKYCESGDILIRDVHLPVIESGDTIAVPASGAYCLSMASNYNTSLKPAIVVVNGGSSRVIRRRESYEDLMRRDV